jgi:hypothetical protein
MSDVLLALELVRAQGEIEQLRAALLPFVDAYDAVGRVHCPTFTGRKSLGHFERAAEVLARRA